MKSKLKIIVLAFCAFFLAANFYAQDNSDSSSEDENAPDIYDDIE